MSTKARPYHSTPLKLPSQGNLLKIKTFSISTRCVKNSIASSTEVWIQSAAELRITLRNTTASLPLWNIGLVGLLKQRLWPETGGISRRRIQWRKDCDRSESE